MKDPIHALKYYLYFCKNTGAYLSILPVAWGATFFSCTCFWTLLLLCFFPPRLHVWHPKHCQQEVQCMHIRTERSTGGPPETRLQPSHLVTLDGHLFQTEAPETRLQPSRSEARLQPSHLVTLDGHPFHTESVLTSSLPRAPPPPQHRVTHLSLVHKTTTSDSRNPIKGAQQPFKGGG